MYLCHSLQFFENHRHLRTQDKHTLLLPFSLLYGIVIGIRNWLFNSDIIKSASFDIPIISIGNLAVGGTGKTPHTEFILSVLQNDWKSAVLSRGYKRKTKGFYLADENSTSQILGDEPFQIHQKFPNVAVAVDEKRVHGVIELQKLIPDLQLVVLDDAYQHRYIQPGFSILLTDFSNLYSHDSLLPYGRLREAKRGSKRADIIVVTKCPLNLKPIDMRLIEMELNPQTNQEVFFSGYVYDEMIPVFPGAEPESWTFQKMTEDKAGVLLVAGIVSPEPIVEYLKGYTNTIKTLFFDDHHAFTLKDFGLIKNEFESIEAKEKILLVTEKDAARLVSNPNFPEPLKSRTFALPIRVEILHDQDTLFIQKIKSYVAENSRNC